MNEPSILAIDLALKKTGMACLYPKHAGPVVWTINTGSKTGHERESLILGEISSAIRTFGSDVVLLEDIFAPAPGQLGPGFFGLAFLHGIIRHHLSETVPWVKVDNHHIKMFAVGKGGGAGTSKQDVMLAVERRYSHLVTIMDDNQADALTLLAMGCHYYGYPLSTMDGKEVPQTHLRSLAMATKATPWPDLTKGKPQWKY